MQMGASSRTSLREVFGYARQRRFASFIPHGDKERNAMDEYNRGTIGRDANVTVEKPASMKIADGLRMCGQKSFEISAKPKRDTVYVTIGNNTINPPTINIMEDEANAECFAISSNNGNLLLRFDTDPDR